MGIQICSNKGLARFGVQ